MNAVVGLTVVLGGSWRIVARLVPCPITSSQPELDLFWLRRQDYCSLSISPQ